MYIMTDRDIRSVQSSFKPTTSDVHVRVVNTGLQTLKMGKIKGTKGKFKCFMCI